MNDISKKNLVYNSGFNSNGKSIENWEFISPRSELAPLHSTGKSNEGKRTLIISSNGDKHAFGYWQGEADISEGNWYRASVKVRINDIEKPDLSINAQVGNHVLLSKNGWSKETLLEQVFKINRRNEGKKIELFLRCTDKGSIEWYEPYIEKIEAPKHRKVRVAAIRLEKNAENRLTIEEQEQRIKVKLEQAGALNSDIVALTEFCNISGVPKTNYMSYYDAAQKVPDGPMCSIISKAAKKHKMYVIAGLLEKRGKYLFNTAVVFDREGEFIGQYDKTHLTFSEMKEGVSCGNKYPLFDLDFGRIGIHICYDEWFPEVSRYYAHMGAEILFLPVMGGKPITWRTRALDNGIYFVSASAGPPSMIIDSSGAIISETHDDGIAFADLNLDYRKTNAYIDPTLSYGMPCIIPQMRNTQDDSLIEKLSEVMKNKIY